MSSHFAGLSGLSWIQLYPKRAWQRQRILKMEDFGEKWSLYEQPLYSRSNLKKFVLRIQYHESQCEDCEVLVSEYLKYSKIISKFS